MTNSIQAGMLWEVFTSIQGEGIYCGQRQTFVRFAGCNLSCDYCDTPAVRNRSPRLCLVEVSPGTGNSQTIRNPISAHEVLDVCRRLGCATVSITGGEPLLQPDFLRLLMKLLKDDGFSIHLETNGTLWRELETVVELADVVAMDIKMPSSAGQGELWNEHRLFLKAAVKSQVFVKAVVSNDTPEEEIQRCAELIASCNPNIPLVIQPVTASTKVSGLHLMKLQERAVRSLADVRVIPQCHRILGVR